MAIQRLSYTEGVIFDIKRDAGEQLEVYLARDAESVRTLPEGEYNITPSVWDRSTHDFSLIVNNDGTGILRQIPLYLDKPSIAMLDGRIDWENGGRLTPLTEDSPIAVIAGKDPDNGAMKLYETIMYSPGRSPEGR